MSAQHFGQDKEEDEEDEDEDDEIAVDTSDEIMMSLTNKGDEKLKKQSKRTGRDEINTLINELAQ